jgi:hypothetical protein
MDMTFKETAMELRSTITCPYCGRQETETMPTDACQYFYDCKGAGCTEACLDNDRTTLDRLWNRFEPKGDQSSAR